jgi:hypothetical protein
VRAHGCVSPTVHSSAFHSAPVGIEILRNEQIDGTSDLYGRSVILNLLPAGKREAVVPYCVAISRVRFRDAAYLQYCKAANPGLGQLFWHFHLSPEFELLQAGRNWDWSDDGRIANLGLDPVDPAMSAKYASAMAAWPSKMWRLYRLYSDDAIDCLIFEVLRGDVLSDDIK